MRRATSASVYGQSWIDVSRVPARRSPRAYGLRSESAPDGWYAPARMPRKPKRAVVTDANGIILAPGEYEDHTVPTGVFVESDIDIIRRVSTYKVEAYA